MNPKEESEVALTLLHTADWHLGLQFPGFPREAGISLAKSRFEAVEGLLGEALRNQVDAVLCAGDLFDEPTPSPDFWQRLAEIFLGASYRGPVFLLPGNHDPLCAGSVYQPGHPFRRALPEWVRVVDDPACEYRLPKDAVLVASPCTRKAGQGDPSSHLPGRAAGDDRIRVGMLHGQAYEIAGVARNFPIDPEAAARRGLDYLALGDWHRFQRIENAADLPTCYPGPIEPARFGEAEEGSAALVRIRSGRRDGGRRDVQIRRIRTGKWRWQRRTCEGLAALESLAAEDGLRTCVLDLTVDALLPLAQLDRAEECLRRLAGNSQASHALVGALRLHRDGLRLDTTGMDAVDWPECLQPVVARLRAADDPEVAHRALYHLYRQLRSAA